jgi:hypothetical protein
MNGSQPMKPVVGQHVRPRREVLAAAEADFEVQRAGAPNRRSAVTGPSAGTAICGSSVSTSACCPRAAPCLSSGRRAG